jgi:aminoglycoside phosphotransferase (APT) family kinase protein
VSTPIWQADIAIDTALAARAIGAQFPQFAGVPIEVFGSGWDNAAFLVDGDTVFRFPRRRVAVRLMERECALLPLIAPLLPLPISAPVFAGSSQPAYPWPFAGYPRIDGATACTIALDAAARGALAAPLGEFLRALHRIDPAPLVARGLRPDEIGRLDHAKRLRLARERAGALSAIGIDDGAGFLRWLENHPPLAPVNSARAIVHGDLYARHVLLDERCAPSGIIDWGDIHLGDPALDIAIAHLMLPACDYAAFRDAYGPIDERTWQAARFRAIYHAFIEIDYGVRENDAGMRAIGTAALELIGPQIESA